MNREDWLPRRIAGFATPIWALRSRSGQDLGIGTTRQLRTAIDWAAENGFGLIQLLPVNETGGDPSPYNALSSRALNPLTLDVSPGALDDAPAALAAQLLARIPVHDDETLRVDYAAVKGRTWPVLRAAFEAFARDASPARREDFLTFRKATAPWLEPYALFRALIEYHGSELRSDWPPHHRSYRPASAWLAAAARGERARIENDALFFSYVQWIAHRQWDEVRAHAERRGVKLMGDVPFGVGMNSADVFAAPELFDEEWFGGAPPEPYFKDDVFTQRWGQNWGIPLYRWERMAADNFLWWRERVRGVCRYFHAYRVDHILGFYRIYRFPWAPMRNAEFVGLDDEQARHKTGGRLPGFFPRDDWAPERAEANRSDGALRLNALLEGAPDAIVIGEDLGVVPDYMRPHLLSLGVGIMKIPMWERNRAGDLASASDYPHNSLAAFGTHDHEPLAGLWSKLYAQCREGQEQNESYHELRRLIEWAGLDPEMSVGPYDMHLAARLNAALLRSNSRYPMPMIVDLLGMDLRFNTPGSVGGDNWRLRLPEFIESWKLPASLRDELG